MSPRIAIFSTMSGSPWGGSEELWRGAAIHLRARGCAVHVSVLDWGKAASPILDELRAAGAEVHARTHRTGRLLRMLRHSRLARFCPPPSFAPYAPTWDFVPDLVLVNQALGLDFLDPVLSARLAKPGPAYALLAQAYPEQPRVLAPNDRLRAVRLLRGAAARFFVSRRNAEVCRLETAADFGPPEVVANPVAIAGMQPEPWPAATPVARLACVGRLDIGCKGQDALLRALASLRDRLPPWSLTLAGAGPHEEYLRVLADDLGLGGHVAFAGQVRDIRALWREHELLILPSRVEGTPLALIEAMVCGRPALVTDVGGCADWLGEECGECAAAATPAALSPALLRLFTIREAWPRLGAAAARRARSLLPADPAGVFAERLRSLAKPA